MKNIPRIIFPFRLLLTATGFWIFALLTANTVFIENLFAQSQIDTARTLLSSIAPEVNRILSFTPTHNIQIRAADISAVQDSAPFLTKVSALYFQGEILVSVDHLGNIASADLQKTLRHEYVHAVIDELSNGQAPAWLDEGLAQILAGAENPASRKAFFSALISGDTPVLSSDNRNLLLSAQLNVPAAYGQAFFATQTLINKFGISKVNLLLKELRAESFPVAFNRILGISFEQFEKDLQDQLIRYKASNEK